MVSRLLFLFAFCCAMFCARAQANCTNTYSNQLLVKLAAVGYSPKSGHGPDEGGWPVDGTVDVSMNYEAEFFPILSRIGGNPFGYTESYFDGWLRARKGAGSATHVLDLFGSGFFVDDQNLADSITGLRWGAFSLFRMLRDGVLKIVPTEVLGDIMNPETWKRLDESMMAREIPKMDLITARPRGGWEMQEFYRSPQNSAIAIAYILLEATSRLSDTGEFYFSFPVSSYYGDYSGQPILQYTKLMLEEDGHRKVDWLVSGHEDAVTNFQGVIRPAKTTSPSLKLIK